MYFSIKTSIQSYFKRSTSIAPLVVFRIVYGAVMTYSAVRFILNDWVHQFYGIPKFFFSYYGFEWVKPLSEQGMLVVYIIMAASFFMVMLGAWYRIFSIVSFLTFTYTELIDQTNYLNHYYFISLVACIMLFAPAHRSFSVDTWRKPALALTHIPVIFIHIIQLQLGIVYFYAGIAKLNYDWLIEAMPLKIWLVSRNDIPLIGPLFNYVWVPYAFSWFGMLYDLSIPFLLLSKRYRGLAYIAVIVFHIMTRVLFQIGMFPFVMIGATLVFFPANFHQKIIAGLKKILQIKRHEITQRYYVFRQTIAEKILFVILIVYVLFQLIFPFRYVCYPDKLFWTEQGFRFSWRVMLMEKMGACYFYVRNPETGGQTEVNIHKYLTPQQEKMMSTQPDMILQFAHHLGKEYQQQGIKNPEVRVLSYVAFNGRMSELFIDPKVDLMKEKDSFCTKKWIKPYKEE
jgi:hypothetical protein